MGACCQNKSSINSSLPELPSMKENKKMMADNHYYYEAKEINLTISEYFDHYDQNGDGLLDESDINQMILDSHLHKLCKTKASHKFAQDFLASISNKKYVYLPKSKFVNDYQLSYSQISMVDQFYIKIKTIIPQKYDEFLRLANAGKRSKCLQLISQEVGRNGLKQVESDLNKYIIILRKDPIHLAKQDKDHCLTKGGLKMFTYPKISFSDAEFKESMTIMVIGQTGTGKTTFLNALANYIMEIEAEDDFRYVLVEQPLSQGIAKSDTSNVTIYNILNRQKKFRPLRIIDTPGFGDTRGLQKDKNIPEMIKKTFQEINEIHLILFVIKSSVTRITQTEKYIIETVCSMFGNDIISNMHFIFTFADAGIPPAQQAIQQSGSEMKKIYDEIPAPKFSKINNSAIFNKLNLQQVIDQKSWEIGIDCLRNLYSKLEKTKAKSLQKSIFVINKRKQLENEIDALTKLINKSLVDQESINNEIMMVEQYQDLINANKGFTFSNKITISVEEKIGPGMHTTYCTYCHFTCHQDCAVAEDKLKKECSSMDSAGNCTCCLMKCFYTTHRNHPYLIKYVESTQQVTSQEMKLKWGIANHSKDQALLLLISMINQYFSIVDQTLSYTERIKQCNEQLSKTSLMIKKQTTTIEYLLILVQALEMEKKPGYRERVKQYQSMIASVQQRIQFEKQNIHETSENQKKKLLNQIQKEKLIILMKKNKNVNKQQSSIWRRIFNHFGFDKQSKTQMKIDLKKYKKNFSLEL